MNIKRNKAGALSKASPDFADAHATLISSIHCVQDAALQQLLMAASSPFIAAAKHVVSAVRERIELPADNGDPLATQKLDLVAENAIAAMECATLPTIESLQLSAVFELDEAAVQDRWEHLARFTAGFRAAYGAWTKGALAMTTDCSDNDKDAIRFLTGG